MLFISIIAHIAERYAHNARSCDMLTRRNICCFSKSSYK